MKKDKSSKTAEQMAISRAIEAMKDENERICYDPYAIQFIRDTYATIIKCKFLRSLVLQFIELMFIGHHHYVLSRTRFIDDTLKEAVNNGIAQLVIKLYQSGYGKDIPSLFIWEGTTPYLTEESVDETLRTISEKSCRGSHIVFDYILRSVIDETCELEGAGREYRYMKKTTEPLTFGLGKEKMNAFLNTRGYKVLDDVNAEFFIKENFSGKYSAKKIKPWWRIAHAITEG